MANLKEAALELVEGFTSTKARGVLRYNAPLYISIKENGDIKGSSNPFLLSQTSLACILIPYEYKLISKTWSSQYTLFLSENLEVDNQVTINGWTLSFDEPITETYRTLGRMANISNGQLKTTVQLPNPITVDVFRDLWRLFEKAHMCCSQESLDEVRKLYCENRL